MPRKDRIDAAGGAWLLVFSLLFGFNQVVIAVANEGLQPVFFAALRSAGAILCVGAWMWLRGLRIGLDRRTAPWGVVMGLVFSAEFTLLFWALDLTTVVRTSVIFYTMPVWLALAAHFLIPGERMTRSKAAGLALAFGGVVVALLDRAAGEPAQGSLLGDLCALGAAWMWAGIALCARATPLRDVRPETQLLCQLVVSAPVLLGLAFAFGPFLREPSLLTWAGLAFQIVAVASFGFILWLWLLTIYPAAHVAAFGFLTPIVGVGLGWALLDEHAGPSLLLALALVAGGLWLVNRPPPGPAAAAPIGDGG